VSFIPVAWAAQRAFDSSNNNVRQWLAHGAPETIEYERFRDVFGADEFALVSWEGCTLQDERLEQFARAITPHSEGGAADDARQWFSRVHTGPRVLAQLMDEPFELSRDEAIARLRGTLVGVSDETSCALVILSSQGDAQRTAALEALTSAAVDGCGIPFEVLRLGGEAVANAAIDIESNRAILRWLWLSCLVACLTTWWCLKSIRLLFVVLATSVYCGMLSTALVFATGGTMNLVLVVMPALVMVLTISGGVHLCGYYRDALSEPNTSPAPGRAAKAGWTPCALAAVTTSLGIVSLCVSRITPVQDFGIYSSAAIMASLLVLFTIFPAVMTLLEGDAARVGRGRSRFDRRVRQLACFVVRHRRSILAAGVALTAFLAIGVLRIKSTVDTDRFFREESKWVTDYAWLEEKLGPLVPIEVVLQFNTHSPERGTQFLDRMELVDGLERRLRGIDGVGATTSAATLAPPVDQRGEWRALAMPLDKNNQHTTGLGGTARRVVFSRFLAKHRSEFEENGYLALDGDGESWRVSVRVTAFRKVDYDVFLEQVRDEVEDYLAARPASVGQARAVCTGAIPLVYVAERELLAGLQKSFLLAFSVILLVLLPLLRNLTAGVLVMLPNVFPAIVIFGTMGWLSVWVDIGAMMSASVALGIAVDDTLHFLTWFRRAARRGKSRRGAVLAAYRRCAPPMVQTTLIVGLSMLVFALSDFQPVAQFGTLICALLASALIGDLIILPAILATRLGKNFMPKDRRRQGSEEVVEYAHDSSGE
jgi:hypothetical protein